MAGHNPLPPLPPSPPAHPTKKEKKKIVKNKNNSYICIFRMH